MSSRSFISVVLRSIVLVATVCAFAGQAWAITIPRYVYFKLQATSSNADGGLVFASTSSDAPSSGSYVATYTSDVIQGDKGDQYQSKNEYSTTVYFFAKASDGYVFKGWRDASGEIVSTEANASFKISISSVPESSPYVVSYTAVFEPAPFWYQLQCGISPSGGGAVWASTEEEPTASDYNSQGYTSPVLSITPSSVTLKSVTDTVYFFAKPASGYVFAGWKDQSGSVVSTSAYGTFVHTISGLTKDSPTKVYYTAVFEPTSMPTVTDPTIVTINALQGTVSLEGSGGVVGKSYVVNYENTGYNMMSVYHFTAANGDRYLVVRDDESSNFHYIETDKIDAGMQNMLRDADGNEIDQRNYTQNNWMLVKVHSDEQYDMVNVYLDQVVGVLLNSKNLIIDATEVQKGDAIAGDDVKALNTYTPINFHTYLENSSQLHTWNADDYSDTKTYFFMSPKRSEVAEVTWMVYSSDGNFYLPSESAYNPYGIKAGVKPVWDYNVWGEPKLKVGGKYSFKAIVEDIHEYVAAAPRRKASSFDHDQDGLPELSDYYEVHPLDVKNEEQIVSGVTAVQVPRQVVGVTYYDLQGRCSKQPFRGLNVVVTRYSDGSRQATKVLR